MNEAAKPIEVQFGKSAEADFEHNTWTFQMPPKYKVRAGEFAIVPIEKYKELQEYAAQESIAFKNWCANDNEYFWNHQEQLTLTTEELYARFREEQDKLTEVKS